jgi:hypothetical protein
MMQAQPMKFTATNDSVTVIYGGKPVPVKRGSANFEGLRRALIDEDWDEAVFHLRSDSSIERWTKGKFKVSNGVVSYNGAALPSDMNNRIVEMASLGDDPTPLMNFWERLQKNPSMRSVQQLWSFLNNIGIPLTADGCFLAYKSVRADFKDVYTGTIDNSVGKVVEMARNQISDNPDHACHAGLHVGALEYTGNFHSGGRMVIAKVDPEHVVCVPNDHSFQKMRVCKYEVIGIHGEGHLPSRTISDEDLPDGSWDPYYDDEDLAYEDDLNFISDRLDDLAQPALRVNVPTGKRTKKLQKLDAMDEAELMQLSYDDLRRYASKGLGIVGAYKITGGKWALVLAISRARV